MAIFGQLVIGGARNDLDSQAADRVVIENGAKGARGEHIHRLIIDFIDPDSGRSEILHGLFHCRVMNVGNHQFGPGVSQQFAKAIADIAKALHRNLDPVQPPFPDLEVNRRPQAIENAIGGRR